MNIRVDDGGVRFRIAADELNKLVDGGALEFILSAGNADFSYSIYPANQDLLEINASGMALRISAENLRRLRDLGRSKDGISFRQGEIEISLQVDLKRAS